MKKDNRIGLAVKLRSGREILHFLNTEDQSLVEGLAIRLGLNNNEYYLVSWIDTLDEEAIHWSFSHIYLSNIDEHKVVYNLVSKPKKL